MIEYAHDSIVVIGGDGTLAFNSPAAEWGLGFGAEENIGKDAFRLMHPDDVAAAREVFAGILGERGGIRFMEFRLRRADGTWRWFEAAGRNLLQDPDIGGVVVTYRDITDRREAAEALRRKDEQLQHARKFEALGRLAGGVAHDFNNLLTVIRGYAQMVRRQLGDAHPLRGDLDEIARATERAAEMIGQLRAFSRGQVLRPEVVELNAVVREAARTLPPLVGAGITVDVATDAGAGWVRADPAQLHRVILNLAANARDAMPSGGTLAVATAFEPGGEGGWSVLSVTDQGAGMDDVTLSHLFEPFFSTKGAGKGTGLGLATSYGIIAQSGGRIDVHSAPGRGTTFRVSLPAVEPPPTRPAVRPERVRRAAGGATILLVEDVANVRTMTRLMLAAGSYRVLEAGDAPEALRVAAAHPGRIDLLLTDIQMPGPDGIHLARELTAAAPQLRVLFMSSVVDRAAVLADSGIAGAVFVEKPFDESVLLDAVREALS